jgi:glycerol-3-phosphate acyltransferase PlsX
MVIAVLRRHHGLDETHIHEALAEFDATRYGAAPLLGVRGVSMICHGNSDARAISVALADAVRAAESGMNELLGQRLTDASIPASTAVSATA